jgi:hypothetical protein
MTCEPTTGSGQSGKRGQERKLLPVQLFIYGVFMPLVLFAHPVRNSVKAYVLALVLSLTMVATIITLGFMAARQTDEFQQKLLMQAMLWGICGTLSITTVWGLLEFFTNVWQLPLLASFPIFLVITMTAKWVLFRSNRPVDE